MSLATEVLQLEKYKVNGHTPFNYDWRNDQEGAGIAAYELYAIRQLEIIDGLPREKSILPNIDIAELRQMRDIDFHPNNFDRVLNRKILFLPYCDVAKRFTG